MVKRLSCYTHLPSHFTLYGISNIPKSDIPDQSSFILFVRSIHLDDIEIYRQTSRTDPADQEKSVSTLK